MYTPNKLIDTTIPLSGIEVPGGSVNDKNSFKYSLSESTQII